MKKPLTMSASQGGEMMGSLVWILAFGYAVGVAGGVTMRKIAPEVWVAYLVYVIIAEALFTVHYLGRYSGLA